jgi:hypothetical protein
MPSTAVKPAKSKTLDKREVIAILGKSKRTVETYIASGRLPCTYVNGRNGKQAYFDPADVARLKREIDNPVSSVAKVRTLAVERQQPAPPAPAALLPPPDYWADVARLVAALAPAPVTPPKPWLTLDEAAEFSGLPKSWLLAQARLDASGYAERCISAINVGTEKQVRWRFNRDALAK